MRNENSITPAEQSAHAAIVVLSNVTAAGPVSRIRRLGKAAEGVWKLGTPAAKAAHAIMASLDAHSWSAGEEEAGSRALEIYDACAVAAWMHPELLEALCARVAVY